MNATSLGIAYYPARSVLASVDECTYSVEVLEKYLKTGEITEFDSNMYKLLENDIATVKEAKLEPYDDMRVQYWDIGNDNFVRMISLLNGAGAVVRGQEGGKSDKIYSLICPVRNSDNIEMSIASEVLLQRSPFHVG